MQVEMMSEISLKTVNETKKISLDQKIMASNGKPKDITQPVICKVFRRF
jgi:hypothetical protein